MQSRTHTCGELRLEHVGQQVQLAGWMENVREVGASLAFSVQARTRISPPATLKSFPTALRFWGSAGITSCRLKLTAAVKRMKRSA